MIDKDKQTLEIAESFINGNISWVLKQLNGKSALTMKVLVALENMGNPYNCVESFKRIIKNR